jgi:hypothetical protein
MKNFKFAKLVSLHLGLLAAGYSSLAWSHELSGSLGVDFWSTDVYLIQCSTDSGGTPDYLEFKILDATQTPAGGKLSAVVTAGGIVTQTGDAGRGDADWSPYHSVHAGNGPYEVAVHKLKQGGNKVYAFEYHCKSSSGAHTGTSAITIQNQ